MNEIMDSAEENIKQVLKMFDCFHKLCENKEMRRAVSKEDIKKHFKIAFFVEMAVEKFKRQNCSKEFFVVLNLWNNSHKRKKDYDEKFYSFACDHLLQMFLKCTTLDAHTIDIAFRVYSALQPKERFQNVLSEFMLVSASSNYILDYIGHQNHIDCKEIESCLLMSQFANQLQIGKAKELISIVEELLSNYRIESSLSVLIRLLMLKTCHDNENEVKTIIMNLILNKMVDRSILSKTFWLSIFKLTDKVDLVQVALQFNNFFVELCKFIIYLGSMMNKEVDNWVGDPDISICPEISFRDVLDMIQYFCNFDQALKKHIMEVVKDAQTTTGSLLWKEIELKITNI